MAPIAFRSQPLPTDAATQLRRRLTQTHLQEPFSALDPRRAAQRTTSIARELGLEVTLYRGALDLMGTEVDHVWIDFQGRVIDVAFPLFVPSFVAVLRDFVVGDAQPADLDTAAAGAGLEDRVLGEFPKPMQYRGEPVWSARR